MSLPIVHILEFYGLLSYFNAFSATIGGGTSQIQKNIIGERVLGLDKD